MLEALPIELIQQIFFYAFEVNMPRASPYLAQSLSNPSIYKALVLFAYFDADEELPVEHHHFLPAEYRRVDWEDKERLQRGILHCKWFGLDLIRSCMPFLSRLQMVQAWHREHRDEMLYELDTQTDSSLQHPVPPKSERLNPLPPLDDVNAMDRHFFATASSSLSYFGGDEVRVAVGAHGYLTRIYRWTTVRERNKQRKVAWMLETPPISILATRVIPDYLLRGNPWTDQTLELLMLLRQGLRFATSSATAISASSLFDGMMSALLSGNIKALLVLLELHWTMMKFEDSETRPNIMLKKPVLVGPFSYPLPINLFHAACALSDPLQSTDMLTLLVREGIDSISRDDDVITAWCLHNPQVPLARFLKQHMESVQDYGLSVGGSRLFDCGRLCRPRTPDFPFPETTFADDIGYLVV
jgi:uncharacterized membrane protein